MAKSREAGATLLEALAFLAIAAIVTIGALSLINAAFLNSTTNAHVLELQTFKLLLKAYLKNDGNYSNVSNKNLIIAGLVPSTMKFDVTDESINNRFGGIVYIIGDKQTYLILTTGVPRESCVKIAQSLPGFSIFEVNSLPNTDVNSDKKIDANEATAACTDPLSNDILYLEGPENAAIF